MPRRVHLARSAVLWIGMAVGSAAAADLPVSVPAVKAPLQVTTNWTGLFIGAEGGQGWGTYQLFFPGPLTRTARFDTSGAVAGGAIGYNWQAPGSGFVVGVEASLAWADITGNAACPNATFTCRTRIDQLHAGTGRIGYAWDRLLIYAKGGFAWTVGKAEVVVPATGAIFDATAWTGRGGYTLGAGLEYMFVPNWSAKVEYDYYHFDGKTAAATTLAGTAVENITMTSRDVNVIKGGVNYHFNWSPPAILARY